MGYHIIFFIKSSLFLLELLNASVSFSACNFGQFLLFQGVVYFKFSIFNIEVMHAFDLFDAAAGRLKHWNCDSSEESCLIEGSFVEFEVFLLNFS